MRLKAIRQTAEDIAVIDPASKQEIGTLPPEGREYWRRRLMAVIARELGITESEARHNVYRHLFGKDAMWKLTRAEALALIGAANAFPKDLQFLSTQEEIVDA